MGRQRAVGRVPAARSEGGRGPMSISRPVVYVAGPYSQGDPAENVATAVHVATMLMDRGWAWPLVPHLTHLWHLIAPRPYRGADAIFWVNSDCPMHQRMTGNEEEADRG